jgi:hypothetical protein
MTDLKTTITGVITGLLTVASHYGIVVPTEWQVPIIAVGVAVGMYFAKDKK